MSDSAIYTQGLHGFPQYNISTNNLREANLCALVQSSRLGRWDHVVYSLEMLVYLHCAASAQGSSTPFLNPGSQTSSDTAGDA